MEYCKVCETAADHLSPCMREKCPVAAYYEEQERLQLGDPEKKTGIYSPRAAGESVK